MQMSCYSFAWVAGCAQRAVGDESCSCYHPPNRAGLRPGGHIGAGDSNDQWKVRPRLLLSSSTDLTEGEPNESGGGGLPNRLRGSYGPSPRAI